jgi:cysteine desulfurase
MTIAVPENYTYLDWAATAPLCAEAARAMAPFLEPGAAGLALGMNANSLHTPGRAAFEAMEASRRSVARSLGASRPGEIVFTSGATEADNAALLGIARACSRKRRGRAGGGAGATGASGFAGRIVTTELEHEAVVEPVRRLEGEGFEIVRLSPDKCGFISAESLEKALAADSGGATVLVSVQAANSEVGAIQPIAELARIAHRAGALFHTDATQALGKMPLDLAALEVDAASFSAHKIGGPKGVGALYLKARTPFEPQMLGGGQESGRRSTTQNVCGMAGFAAACEHAVAAEAGESARLRQLRDALYARLGELSGVRPTVEVEPGSTRYLPNIVHVLVSGFESETLVLRLDAMGFGVSGGSACSSHSLEPSRVLRAMSVSADEAFGALRVSMGSLTTADDVERFARALKECVC